MSTRERVRVMLEWFGRRQTIALPINSVVGCLIATILLMILSENNVRTLTLSEMPAQQSHARACLTACSEGRPSRDDKQEKVSSRLGEVTTSEGRTRAKRGA